MNKSKKILTIGGIFLTVIIIIYILCYLLIFKDNSAKYLSLLKVEDSNEMIASRQAYINEFGNKNCEIKYCIYTACENSISLPCDRIGLNEYDKAGFYKINLNFSYYNILPIGKKYLKDWEIVTIDPPLLFSKESYISGVKKIISEHLIRNGYSCNLLLDDGPLEFYCGREFSFDNDYLQSIYLTHVLGNKLGDKELIDFALQEISYLNTNKEEILASDIKYPEAYILKLLELGLDEEYLQVIDNFQIPEYEIQELDFKETIPLLPIEEELYLRKDLRLFLYSDYSMILEEFNRIELANYYKNELIRYYNALQYGSYPLCTMGKTSSDDKVYTYVKDSLEKAIIEENDILLLNSVKELLTCKEYLDVKDAEVINLKFAFEDALRKSTLNIAGDSYIIDTSYVCINDSTECNDINLDYNLVTNLRFILYE